MIPGYSRISRATLNTDLTSDSVVDFVEQRVPSTVAGVELAAGVVAAYAAKLLLGRGGPVLCAPRGMHFDAYRNRLVRTWRPWGNRNPLQRLMFALVRATLVRATLGKHGRSR